VDIVECDEYGISRIFESYQKGGIIGFPTDTVYGLGCDPFNKNSITKIFEMKKRSDEKKFPILGFSTNELEKIVEFNPIAKKISKKFWPGQLTLLLPIRKEIVNKIENNGKLAVRIPKNQCILSILKECKLIVGTSANISGEESIKESHDCILKLPQIDVLVDGGKIVSSGESTIIDFDGNGFRIIREGSIAKEEIEKSL
tara:strand:- start:4456 stop:5055 length:600 start_codon:yes stop_codon:yes gene_type:complete